MIVTGIKVLQYVYHFTFVSLANTMGKYTDNEADLERHVELSNDEDTHVYFTLVIYTDSISL